MRYAIVALLIVIAGAVSYLAWTEYQERRVLERAAELMTDPERFHARRWAEQAKMDCADFSDVELITTRGGIERPVRFTCVTSDYERWLVADRPCSEEEQSLGPNSPGVASGEPRSEDQLYKPVHALCWSVTRAR